MTTYLVQKRLVSADGVSYPGEVLTDPENAAILLRRGFITPVPEGFEFPSAEVADSGPEPESATTDEDDPTPTVDEFIAAGYSQEAAEILARGESSDLTNEETGRIEQVLEARPEIFELAKALDEPFSSLAELSDEDYQKLVEQLATEPGAGTVGAAEDTAVVHSS